MAYRDHETSLNRHHQRRTLRRSEGRKNFSGPFASLKHHLSDFIQVDFFDFVFVWPIPWYIASSTSAKSFLRRSVGRYWFLTTFRLLKTSLQRLRTNRLFECQKCRKCFRMAFLQYKTSMHRLHQRRILRR
jgi:hypothetical protein